MTAAPASAAGEADAHLRPLDGLRGAAVVLVIAYHASYLTAGWGPRLLPGGFVGVDLFFVLSGFLITRKLAVEWSRRTSIDLGQFAERRIRRLVPALVALVVVVVGFRLAWPAAAARDLGGRTFSSGDSLASGLGALAYLSNWQQAWGWAYIPELSHTWSLAIEGQYYLVWPLVLLALWKLGTPRLVQVGLVVGAMVVIWIQRAAMWTDQAHYLPLYLRTDTRVDVLLAGSILGLLAAWGGLRVGSARWLRLPALAAAVALGVVSCLSETGDVHLYRDYGLVAVLAASTAIVASAVTDPGFALTRLWDLAPLRWLGLRSYSLYLWHVPVFLTIASNLGDRPAPAKLALGLVVTFAAAEASYRFVEQPFRRRRAAG